MRNKQLDLLFQDVPDSAPAFITDTFVNRGDSLAVANALFSPEQPGNQIYAIHGSSRTGKSHLAMKIVHDLKQNHHVLAFTVNANIKGAAIDILKALYEQLNLAIRQWPETQSKTDYLTFTQSYLNDMNKLILLGATKISMKKSLKLAEKLSASFKAKLPFLQIGVGGEQSTGNDQEASVEFSTLDVAGLRSCICVLLELMTVICDQTIVILVDDLDLLEELPGGSTESSQLIPQLKFIAELPRIAIFITSRRHYFIERQKEMYDFLDVSRLTEDHLKQIYDRRITLFNQNEPMFEAVVVNQLIMGFNGIVGAFLYECHLFMRHFITGPFPLKAKHLNQHLIKTIGEFRDNPETEMILLDIEKAVLNKQTEMVIMNVEKKHGFLYRVLIPKGYQQDTYVLMPLFAKTLHTFFSAE